MAGGAARRHAEPAASTVWYWWWFLFLAFWPRLFLIGFWVFGSRLGDAFDGWVVPVLGFVIAPSTTVAYALMWGSTDGVSGAEWLVVAFGVLLDLWAWGAARAVRSAA